MALRLAVQNIPVVYADFMEKHYFPKLKALQNIDPAKKSLITFLSWGSVAFAGNILDFYLRKNKEMIDLIGLIDEDGMLDLDATYNAAKFMMEKTGTLTIHGFDLDSSDIEIIYNIAKPLAI